MHEKLVKRLKAAQSAMSALPHNKNFLLEHYLALEDAISALTAQQAETCEKVSGDGVDLDKHLGTCMAPGCKTKATEWYVAGVHRRECCEGHRLWCFRELDKLNAQDAPRPWTRKDGSTTPRGDVVDRRKSEYGNYREAPGGIPRRCQIPERDFYGRRSGDRARWTVQETPQTLEKVFQESIPSGVSIDRWLNDFDADPTSREAFVWLLRELDRRSAVK